MTNELIKYIRKMQKQGKEDFNIKISLEVAGWDKESIENSFKKLKKKKTFRLQIISLIIVTLLIIAAFYFYYRIKFYNGNILPENDDITQYVNEPKELQLKYFLNSEFRYLNFTAYGQLNNYYSKKNKEIPYFGKKPDEKEIISRFIEDKKQDVALTPLIDKIRSVNEGDEQRARVAISLVQLIPYEKGANESSPIKYPYEVIFSQTGVCSDKSKLLILLLRELGFGVAIIKFYEERHDAVGIKCPVQYSYMNTSYCFIETTSLSIITDSGGEYAGKGVLKSIGEVIPIYDGKSLDGVKTDFNDLSEMRALSHKNIKDSKDYQRLVELIAKYGFYNETQK